MPKTEDQFYLDLINNDYECSVFLVNGVRLQVKLITADEYCLLVASSCDPRPAATSLIMKHAISSVVPSLPRDPGICLEGQKGDLLTRRPR